MTKRVVCDLDGVVFDFDRTWIERHRAWWPDSGLDLRPNMPQRWGDIVPMSGLGSAEAFWNWWSASGGWEQMEVYAGAVEALSWLDRQGYEILYATNRPLPDSQTRIEMGRWGLPQRHRLQHVERKWEIPTDLFLEDAPGNLILMQAEAPTLRIERPWNNPMLYPELAPALGLIPAIPNLRIAHLKGHIDEG